jgi:hypothetical protein
MNDIEAIKKEFNLTDAEISDAKNAMNKSIENALAVAPTARLLTELVVRGQEMQKDAEALSKRQEILYKATGDLQNYVTTVKATFQEAAGTAAQKLNDMIGMFKTGAHQTAEATRSECQALTQATDTKCHESVQALQTECLKRVAEAEAKCQAAVESANSRADAAEEEAVRCLEQVDRAVATANALGSSFNQLSERFHGLEATFRMVIMGGGAGQAPVWTPAATPVSAPAPLAPVPEPPANTIPFNGNGNHAEERTRPNTPPMQFVLIGLHQKDIERIRQKLPKHVGRAADMVVIEDTTADVMPRKADYCLVTNEHDNSGDRRWKFCLETYGSAKCVRLANSSISAFRAKIEELYTARYPLIAPANLNSVANALHQVAALG